MRLPRMMMTFFIHTEKCKVFSQTPSQTSKKGVALTARSLIMYINAPLHLQTNRKVSSFLSLLFIPSCALCSVKCFSRRSFKKSRYLGFLNFEAKENFLFVLPSIHFVHITVRLCASSSKRTKLRVEKRSGAHKITKAVRKEIFYYLVRSNSRAHLGFIGRERECWEELWESARSKFLEAKKRNCSTFYKPKERSFCR